VSHGNALSFIFKLFAFVTNNTTEVFRNQTDQKLVVDCLGTHVLALLQLILRKALAHALLFGELSVTFFI